MYILIKLTQIFNVFYVFWYNIPTQSNYYTKLVGKLKKSLCVKKKEIIPSPYNSKIFVERMVSTLNMKPSKFPVTSITFFCKRKRNNYTYDSSNVYSCTQLLTLTVNDRKQSDEYKMSRVWIIMDANNEVTFMFIDMSWIFVCFINRWEDLERHYFEDSN